MAAPQPIYVHHRASLEHDTGAHPERAARIEAIESYLGERDWLGYRRVEAPRASEEQLLAVHPGSHIAAVRSLSERGGGHFDPDTALSPGSYEAALRGAGGACAMVDELLAGTGTTGFCALRPPGHHAEPAVAMGFCLFNSVAVGATHAIERHGLERVLILDWDVHHGNGTNAVFHERADVLFASIHQSPLYPGSGPLSDGGAGAGRGFSLNLPVPPGSGEPTWVGLVEHVVLPVARSYAPQLVLISAGFDGHRDDPLADCLLEESSFAAMAQLLRGLGVPVGAVLEGGYDVGALARSVAATMVALADPGQEAPPSAEPDGVVVAARSALSGYWPAELT